MKLLINEAKWLKADLDYVKFKMPDHIDFSLFHINMSTIKARLKRELQLVQKELQDTVSKKASNMASEIYALYHTLTTSLKRESTNLASFITTLEYLNS